MKLIGMGISLKLKKRAPLEIQSTADPNMLSQPGPYSLTHPYRAAVLLKSKQLIPTLYLLNCLIQRITFAAAEALNPLGQTSQCKDTQEIMWKEEVKTGKWP